jgi:hypothetical protein
MRIFNLQDLGAPDKPKKKKIKYAEIDFTSHHSFLRVRRDQFRQNCKKTHPNAQSVELNKKAHLLLNKVYLKAVHKRRPKWCSG